MPPLKMEPPHLSSTLGFLYEWASGNSSTCTTAPGPSSLWDAAAPEPDGDAVVAQRWPPPVTESSQSSVHGVEITVLKDNGPVEEGGSG